MNDDFIHYNKIISGRPVLIFDGVCELCNTSVNFIMKRDKTKQIMFTANQNKPGATILRHFGMDPDEVHSLYLFENGKLYSHSTGALRISRHLKFPWFLLYGFIIVPSFLRNWIYNLIARNRYRWFGKKDTCRIPTPEEIARFLMD